MSLNVIIPVFLNKKKAARASRIRSELDAAGIVACRHLKVSKEGISVKRRRIDWSDILKIQQFLAVVSVNGMKGSGHPVLRIYCRDNPNRARFVVDMRNVHNSDIVLPLSQSMLQSKLASN